MNRHDKNILVVEDEAIIALNQKKNLEEYGYSVILAHTGEEALECMHKESIDLVLMDIDLKDEMDGALTAKKILQEFDVPLVFLSNHTEPEIVEKTEEISSYGYVIKQSTITVLDTSIQMAFRLFDEKTRVKEHQEKLEENNKKLKLMNEELINTNRYLEESKQELLEREKQLDESQKRYIEIFQGSRDGYVMVDKNGSFLDANQGYCDMLGYSLEELKQVDTFYNITPKQWHQWEYEEIWVNRLLKKGYSGLYEKEYIHKNGTIFPVELQSYAVFDENGEPSYLWGIARDITLRKKAENELKLFKESVESSSDAIGMSTAEGIHFYQNKQFDELFGEIGSDPPSSTYVNESIGREIFNTIMAGGEWSGEVEMYDKDKNIRHILLRAYSSKDEDGNVVLLVGSHSDITARKQTENELNRALEAKDALFRELQHRVKNSLTIIFSMISLKMNKTKNSEANELLKDIGTRVRALAELYELLYENNIYTNIRLDIYLEKVTAFITSMADNITIQMDFEETYSPFKDASTIGLILTELVTNAVKHAFPNNRSGTIEIFLKTDIEGIVLEVADNGIGLPEKFNTIKDSSIGFEMITSMVKQLDGTLEYDSNGKVIFTVFIPQ